MKGKVYLCAAGCVFLACVSGRADFKYTKTSQITGGAMAGMMKGLSVFSKSARQATRPMASVTYVKGSRLRSDESDGSYQIIDLDARRITHVDPNAHSYSVTTFDQMRAAVEQMSQQMDEAMKNQAAEKNTNVTITPKIEVTPTGQAQTILGQNTQEVKIKIEMLMQATDAEHGTQSGSMITTVDSWMAPSVGGYQEVADFYKKMATEIGWTPGGAGMDQRLSRSLAELYKGGKFPQGLPMMQVLSLGTTGQAPQQQAEQQSAQPPAPQSNSTQGTSAPSEVAAKALGGMFGGFGHFGHKKKQQEDQASEQQQNQQQAQSAQASNANSSASLMEITTRVTSFSTDPLDSALFDIPPGYQQVPSDAEKMLQGQR